MMADMTSRITSTSTPESASRLPSTPTPEIECKASSELTDVRQQVLALRQRKKEQLSGLSKSNATDETVAPKSDRLTWVGLDDLDPQSIAGPEPGQQAATGSRCSDDEDEAASTILGHYVSALPLPPQRKSSHDQTSPGKVNPTKQSSLASHDNQSSSHESISLSSSPLLDDLDATGWRNPATSTSRSSGASSSASRHANASHRTTFASSSLTSTKALGPPPSIPLPPPPPTSSPSPSLRHAEIWKTRRSSNASAATASSMRSSTSIRASWKSGGACLASARLTLTPSEKSNTSDYSDDEIVGIRRISNQFPSPNGALSLSSSAEQHPLGRSASRASSQSRISAPLLKGVPSRRSPTVSHRALSPVQGSPLERHFHTNTSNALSGSIDHVEGEGSSDTALSDVLDITDNLGTLTTAAQMQQTPSPGFSVARVGLGARSLSRYASEHSLRTKRVRSPVAPSVTFGELGKTQDEQMIGIQGAERAAKEHRKHHKRTSAMTRSISELVAALDLEANEWGHRLRDSQTSEVDSPKHDLAQTADAGRQANQVQRSQVLSASQSTPSLSSSGSQDLSQDDSRDPPTAETSFIHVNGAKDMHRIRNSADTEAGAEFRSIYDAYRGSTSTMASYFAAPVVRIEDPQGGEVSDAELDDGNSSAEDMPRKRNKASRRNGLGFEEQRAALRPRPLPSQRTSSLSKGGHSSSAQQVIESDDPVASSSAAATASNDADPYAFYEFSPSLPPFMPSGVTPRDLTGRGTWSSIVARASERMRSRQPSIASLATFQSEGTGPISMRQIRTTAQAKQRQVDAAHRAREQMSEQIASMSYRPFAIHDHALTFASHAVAPVGPRSSISSTPSINNFGSAYGGFTLNRTNSVSSMGCTEPIAPSVGEYGSRWPIAVGADQAVGPDDVSSLISHTPWASRRSSAEQPKVKVMVEFSMQTSPEPSPTKSNMPVFSDSLTVDDRICHADAETKRISRGIPAMDYLGIDAPFRRRRSTASLISIHALDAELDQPGLWPSKIRAPRLSSSSRRRSDGGSRVQTSGEQGAASDDEGGSEESDLDVNADLEDLAERSGVLDASRGSKRKLHARLADEHGLSNDNASDKRQIASIPARARRISAALDRIRAQRLSREAGWNTSDDEQFSSTPAPFSTPRKGTASGRPSLPTSAPAKIPGIDSPLRRSKSLAVYGRSKVNQHTAPTSSVMLKARSPSPDLSALSQPSDDEEVLLTADLGIEAAELSHESILDEEFDMMVGQTISSRFSSTPSKPERKSSISRNSSETSDLVAGQASEEVASNHSDDRADKDGDALRSASSQDSQQTQKLPSHSRASSVSSVIEMIQEADELLSSAQSSVGHAGNDGSRAESVDRVALSPGIEDTPTTLVGSGIWSSFNADRLSSASTATAWSDRSADDAQSREECVPSELISKSTKAQTGGSAETKKTVIELSSTSEAIPIRSTPVMSTKSSGLPRAQVYSQCQQRPSLSLATKSHSMSRAQPKLEGSGSGIPGPKIAIRRYQSLASLPSKGLPIERPQLDGAATTAAKDSATGRIVRAPARLSDGGLETPCNPSRRVASITPSKLPSLRSPTSNANLRSSGLPTARAAGGKRLASPQAGVRPSGLPLSASLRAASSSS